MNKYVENSILFAHTIILVHSVYFHSKNVKNKEILLLLEFQNKWMI